MGLVVLGAQSAPAAGRGQVGAWGYNQYGQVGDGSTTDQLTPVRVHGSHGVGAIAIDAGEDHSLALKSDGTVWAWGHGLGGVERVAAGGRHRVGLGPRLLWSTWGWNAGGPSCFCRTVPVQVRVLSGVTAVSAGGGIFKGGAHNLALSNDGTAWAGGYDYYDELGDGTRGISPCFCQTTPVQTQRLANVTAISAGGQHSLALRLDT